MSAFSLCRILVFLLLFFAVAGVAEPCRVTKEHFGTSNSGESVEVYTLVNSNGVEVRVMTLGATLLTVKAPDRKGNMDIITLHRKSFEAYEKGHPYFGSVIGRFAGRIAYAGFTLDGEEYKLVRNKGPHHIHGGDREDGFAWQLWSARMRSAPDAVGVEFSLISPDGQAGFPGKLDVTVTYILTDDNQLILEYSATTDQTTHVNLTNHTYWNLAGADSGRNILKHRLQVNADRYLPGDELKVPTGEIAQIADTPMDFREPREVGERMEDTQYGHYDHGFMLNETPDKALKFCARLEDAVSGRILTVHTTQPGVQLFTGNKRGVCLETQHFSNSPNEPRFPSTVLRPGERFYEKTVFQFLILKTSVSGQDSDAP